MKIRHLIILILPALLLFACLEDRVELSNLDDRVLIEGEIAAPIIKASLLFEDFAGENYDSLIIQVLDTLKLFSLENISFQDTFSIDLGEAGDFDFMMLHHRITNMFPVGLDLRLLMYDSIASQNVDTVFFSDTPGEIFLQSAPTDADGVVIESEVQSEYGVVALNEENFDNLFDRTTHLIIDAEVPSTEGFAKIKKYYHLDLQLAFELGGSFLIDPEEDEQ